MMAVARLRNHNEPRPPTCVKRAYSWFEFTSCRRLTDRALSCAPPVEGKDTSGGRPANRPPVRPPDGWEPWQADQAAARQLQRLVRRPAATCPLSPGI